MQHGDTTKVHWSAWEFLNYGCWPILVGLGLYVCVKNTFTYRRMAWCPGLGSFIGLLEAIRQPGAAGTMQRDVTAWMLRLHNLKTFKMFWQEGFRFQFRFVWARGVSFQEFPPRVVNFVKVSHHHPETLWYRNILPEAFACSFSGFWGRN